MRGLAIFLKNFTFWGIMFLLILTLAFHVQFKDVVDTAVSGGDTLRYVCIFMLVSIPLFVLVLIIQAKADGLSLLTTLIMTIGLAVGVPYKGLDGSGVKWQQSRYPNDAVTRHETNMQGFRVFQMVIWWLLFGFIIYSIASSKGSPIRAAFTAFQTTDLLKTAGILLLIYILLCFIAKAVVSWDMKR